MRMHRFITLSVAAMFVAACDVSSSTHLAAVGPTAGVSSSRAALVVSPTRLQTSIGNTAQLSTNTPAELRSQLQWTTSSLAVASVTQLGLVTALGPGTAVITVRYVTDTTNQASAVVEVAPAVQP